jgi:hypothetical protein
MSSKALNGQSMSALGHKRTFAPQKAMSALPPKADIPQRTDTSLRGIVARRDGAGTADHTHRNMGREIGSLSL